MKNEPESEPGTETESLKIRLPKRTYSAAQFEDDDVVPDSEDEDEDSEEESKDDDDDYGDGPSLRKPSTRKLRSKSKKELPFSPRKTRSRKVIAIGSESELSEESDEDEDIAPVRRSTRTRKATEINLVSDDDEYTEDNRDESRAKKIKGHGKSKKNKSSPPMYGHIRSIGSLDDDPFSDEENEPLRFHRDICEKCHRPPAHKLLENFKKSKGKGRKRKRSTDDEFEESDGEQTYLDMGGWVRW